MSLTFTFLHSIEIGRFREWRRNIIKMDWGLHAFKKRMVEIFALESVRFGFKYELRFVLVV